MRHFSVACCGDESPYRRKNAVHETDSRDVHIKSRDLLVIILSSLNVNRGVLGHWNDNAMPFP